MNWSLISASGQEQTFRYPSAASGILMLDPDPKFNPFKPYFDGLTYIDLPQPYDNRMRDSEYI